jgi:heme o synthase
MSSYTDISHDGALRAAVSLRSRAVDFYELTKPRMNFLVVLTTMIGFLTAAGGTVPWFALLHALLGTAMCAAGASVLNQFAEREYDRLMPRTRNRPLPAGRLAPVEALVWGLGLCIGGVLYLAVAVNTLTAGLGLLTILLYVLLYTPLKRYTTLNTVIGAVPGAIPPVMGWTAAAGALSPEALVLFAILFFWQMPHFLAIAILYRDDYARGGFRMLPVVDAGLHCTGRQIVLYALAMVPVSLLPVLLGMAGAIYATAAVLLGLAFLSFAVSCALTGSRADARWLFVSSILYLPALLGMMMVG